MREVSRGAAGHRPGEVAVATMHLIRCVAVIGVGQQQVSAASAVTSATDDQRSHDLDIQHERCLLFVACTRARENLVVSWHGTPSSLLPT
jgi:superfamily I DNA/RNA helicase